MHSLKKSEEEAIMNAAKGAEAEYKSNKNIASAKLAKERAHFTLQSCDCSLC
jgi:hypothetical protein